MIQFTHLQVGQMNTCNALFRMLQIHMNILLKLHHFRLVFCNHSIVSLLLDNILEHKKQKCAQPNLFVSVTLLIQY